MNISIDTALAIACGYFGCLVVFNFATALVGVAFRVGVQRIQFGYSPSILLFHIGRTELRLSPFLLGGHVKFVPPEIGDFYAPWPVRALLALTGPFATLAVCAIPLGNRVLHEALIAWPQMWVVATDFSSPVDLNSALRPELDGIVVAAAVTAVKAAMFNLLPLAMLGGGTFVITLLEAMTRREIYSRLPQPILWASLVIMLSFVIVFVLRVVTGT